MNYWYNQTQFYCDGGWKSCLYPLVVEAENDEAAKIEVNKLLEKLPELIALDGSLKGSFSDEYEARRIAREEFEVKEKRKMIVQKTAS